MKTLQFLNNTICGDGDAITDNMFSLILDSSSGERGRRDSGRSTGEGGGQHEPNPWASAVMD